MRFFISSIIVVVIIMLSLFIPQSSDSTVADKDCAVSVLTQNPQQVEFDVCGNRVSVDPSALTTLPPLPPVTVRVPVPGPTVTVPGPRVNIPGPKVLIPGPTKTVTPAPVTVTKTVTQRPEVIERTNTTTATPKAPESNPARPQTTVTATPDPAPTPPRPRGIIFDDDITSDEVVATSVAGVLVLALATLMLYVGYVLGYKDKERKDTTFIRAVLNRGIEKRH